MSCTRRNRSNTPLQALTLLNDSGFFEYAQGLAARVVRECAGDDGEKLRYAFRVCLSREPSEREAARLKSFLVRQQSELKAESEDARRLSPADPALAPSNWISGTS